MVGPLLSFLRFKSVRAYHSISLTQLRVTKATEIITSYSEAGCVEQAISTDERSILQDIEKYRGATISQQHARAPLCAAIDLFEVNCGNFRLVLQYSSKSGYPAISVY